MTSCSAEQVLCTYVRAALADAGISQVTLARRLGISAVHVNRLLRGYTPLTLAWAEQMLALCGKRVVITVVRDRHPVGNAEQ
jgi:transcriptional regulator with XRE-family HTH domain